MPHVRDTISDRELEVWALLDVTPSMNWGTEGVTKRDLGIAAVATIGFLSQRMGDRFGGYVMRPDGSGGCPRVSGRSALYGAAAADAHRAVRARPRHRADVAGRRVEQLSRTATAPRPAGGGVGLPHPRRPRARPERRAGVGAPMRRLAVRNQVLAVEVVDRHEVEFADVGDMLIRDPETDFERYVNTSDPAARARMDAAQRRPAGTNPDRASSCWCRAHPAAHRPRLGAGHRPVRAGLPPRRQHAARAAAGGDEVIPLPSASSRRTGCGSCS